MSVTRPKRVTRLAVRAGRPGRAQRDQGRASQLQRRRGELAAPFLDRVIRHGVGQDVKARFWQSRPFFIDIALAITDFGHHLRLVQNRLGGLCRAQPPLRFLLGQRSVPVVNAHPAIACPYPARGQAQNAARFRIHTQHCVQQNTTSGSLADLARTAAALRGRREIEFAAVLDRQNMPADAALRKLRAPAIEQRLDRHAGVGQKARKSDNPTASATRQLPKAGARARHHSRERQTPLFAKRSSPKSPSPQLSKVITSRPPFKVGQPNHASQNPSNAPGKPNPTMCVSLR